jgi:hypothetical protein
MADFQKRAKQTRKQAAKRAKKTQKRARASVKSTRKAVGKTSTRTRAQALAAFGVALGAAAAVGRLLKSSGKDEQRYSSEPDNLPNTPARPAATTPPPGAGTREMGSDTGTMTETERARAEQTSS